MHGDLQINPKFKEILPVLTEDEYKHLETSLKNESCRDALLVWRNQIVDGHNRFEICQKHGIDYRVNEMPFVDEDEALEWMLTNQLGRRNVSEQQKLLYISQIYELQKKRAGAPEGNEYAVQNKVVETTTLNSNEPDGAAEVAPQFVKKPAKTREKVAAQLGVTPAKVQTAVAVGRALNVLPAETKTDFLAGKVTQKAVIEQAKEAAAPQIEPADSDFDDFTELAKEWGLKAQLAITKVQNLGQEIHQAFKSKGRNLFDFAPSLAAIDNMLKPEALEAGALKKLAKCPAHELSNCTHCDGLGYLSTEKAASVRDIVAYRKAGGKTYDSYREEKEAVNV